MESERKLPEHMTLGGKTKIWTSSYLVPTTVWAVLGLGEGKEGEWGGGSVGGGTATSEAIIWGWDHCLAPSLHAYGSERLSQPSSTTGCVISSLSPPRCARTFFFRGIFVHIACRLLRSSDFSSSTTIKSTFFTVWKTERLINLCI